MPTRFYYDAINNSTYLNTIYSADIALENHFANMLFGGDLNRIIYSSNQYAFRKRAQLEQKDYSALNLPFMNYKNPQHINPDTDRFYWNHIVQLEGLYSDQLGRKIRAIPFRIEYESSIWFHQAFDLQYAMSLLNNDYSNETIVPSYVTVKDKDNIDVDIEIPLYLGHNFSANEYEEDQWLEENRIFNQGIDFIVDGMMLFDDSPVSLSESISLDFISAKDEIADNPSDTESQVLLQEYFTEGDLT